MTPDTDFEKGQGEVDDLYQQMYGGGVGTEEAPRQLAMKVLPRFDYYHVDWESATPQIAREKGTPGIRFGLRVKEGPVGTDNLPCYDTLWLTVSKYKFVKGEEVKRSEEEWEKAKEELHKTLVRLAKQLHNDQAAPASFSNVDLAIYGNQFVGKSSMLAIGVDRARKDRVTGEEYPARNRCIWRSVDDPAAAARNAKGDEIPGLTSLEEGRQKVIKFNEKLSKDDKGQKEAAVAPLD